MMNLATTAFALLPPLVAIIMGLITKKVNLSLVLGIIVGALLYCSFNPMLSISTAFSVMAEEVSGNIGVIFFVILLGMFVYLLDLSGASKAYGDWARRKIKSKRSSLIVTFLLGILIFVDDYFNCLTVGTVMRPVTDRQKISREKLAYVIDTTAAPICMIAPISSWAAAVSSSLPDGTDLNGFSLFVKSIFSNYYSLFSIVMVFALIALNLDFGKMKEYEDRCCRKLDDEDEQGEIKSNASIIDLILPVAFLMVSCVFSMLYTGGIFSGVGIIDAFANCDAILGLCIGTFLSCVFLLVLYVPRNIVSAEKYGEGLIQGFKNMVPSILILCFAWTLGGICGQNYLDAGGFISELVSTYNVQLSLMPMFFFVVAILLSFSTGTSWGTFAILIPMEVSVFNGIESSLLIITTAAVLGGSVCGDHLSPISDTTILSSTGAKCDHINHVQSQAVYGAIVAAVAFVSYIIAGLSGQGYLGLIFGASALIILLVIIKGLSLKKAKKNA